ncbi:unnamed protein product [Polarella glacialis]|uniref:Uncharacterized protein n=1 Tax=Polarella glacialis TaxID=89957 RepID=A0A813I2M0_POLGL|nr:unnamed protein product [Polarella glacialis]
MSNVDSVCRPVHGAVAMRPQTLQDASEYPSSGNSGHEPMFEEAASATSPSIRQLLQEKQLQREESAQEWRVRHERLLTELRVMRSSSSGNFGSRPSEEMMSRESREAIMRGWPGGDDRKECHEEKQTSGCEDQEAQVRQWLASSVQADQTSAKISTSTGGDPLKGSTCQDNSLQAEVEELRSRLEEVLEVAQARSDEVFKLQLELLQQKQMSEAAQKELHEEIQELRSKCASAEASEYSPASCFSPEAAAAAAQDVTLEQCQQPASQTPPPPARSGQTGRLSGRQPRSGGAPPPRASPSLDARARRWTTAMSAPQGGVGSSSSSYGSSRNSCAGSSVSCRSSRSRPATGGSAAASIWQRSGVGAPIDLPQRSVLAKLSAAASQRTTGAEGDEGGTPGCSAITEARTASPTRSTPLRRASSASLTPQGNPRGTVTSGPSASHCLLQPPLQSQGASVATMHAVLAVPRCGAALLGPYRSSFPQPVASDQGLQLQPQPWQDLTHKLEVPAWKGSAFQHNG